MRAKHILSIVLPAVLLIAALVMPNCSGEGGGSGTEDGDTDSTPADGHDGLPDSDDDGPICDEEEFGVQGTDADVLIVIDRSESMSHAAFWGPTRNAVIDVTQTYDAVVRFGLMVFPGDRCLDAPDYYCEPGRSPIVEIDFNRGERIDEDLMPMETCGGTPIALTLVKAHEYMAGLESTNPKYIILATDGAPNCNAALDKATCRCSCLEDECTPVCPSNELCLDDTATYQAIDDMAGDGIRTFVIGMSTAAEDWGDVLSAMASHGGTDDFYPAEDTDQLSEVFETITGMIATCRYDVNPSDAADREKVNFYFDGEVVPMDPDNAEGWNWEDYDTIVFYGSYCDMIMSGEVEDIAAKYGCPSSVI